MKKPQWSIYSKNITKIEYSICKLCIHFKSDIVFDYQIIDTYLLVTKSDEFREIFYSDSIHRNFLKNQIFLQFPLPV